MRKTEEPLSREIPLVHPPERLAGHHVAEGEVNREGGVGQRADELGQRDRDVIVRLDEVAKGGGGGEESKLKKDF